MNFFTYNFPLKVFSFSLLVLIAPIGASLFGSVATDVSDARNAWASEDVTGAIASLESALSHDPRDEEASFLLALFQLAVLAEDPTLTRLLTDAGASWYSGVLFDIDVDYDVYQSALPLGTNAAVWTYDTDGSMLGGDAARSGAITHDQISAMEIALSGSGLLQFDYKVSTEQGFDFLEVYLDGDLVVSQSGDFRETHYEWLDDGGAHQLIFVYRKDESTDAGEDAVWVDNVRFNYQQQPSLAAGTLSAALDYELPVSSVLNDFIEPTMSTDIPLFDDEFTSGDVLDWLTQEAAPRIQGVKELLENVTSTNFLTQFSPAETFGMQQEVDYYDVLMLRASMEGVLGVLGILDEYNIDVLVDELAQLYLSDGVTAESTLNLQWLLEVYPQLLQLNPSADLSQAEQALRNLKTLYFQASDGIFARSYEIRRLFNEGKERPAADSSWFAQTIESHSAGGDAAKSGNVKQWLSEGDWDTVKSTMSITVEGPGELTFGWMLSNYNNVMYPSHWVELIRLDGSWGDYLGSLSGSQTGWRRMTVSIPAGVQTLEWRYYLYGHELSEADGAFVDEVVYTPTGGIAQSLEPGASSLDLALDASLNAHSENAMVNSLGVSMSADQEVRQALTDLVATFDGRMNTSIGEFTLRPLFDGQVDLNALLPDFSGNRIVRGSFSDPTLAGIFPQMTEDQLESLFQDVMSASVWEPRGWVYYSWPYAFSFY